MANKRERQHAILELIRSRVIGSQEELRQILEHRGWDVTQSTLSRDMKELRLARVQTSEGVRYTSPAESAEGRHAALSALLPQLFLRLDGVGVLLVMKTTVGSAEAAAAVLDAEHSADLVGTLAGDDTVLLICRSEAARERLSRRILQLAQRLRRPGSDRLLHAVHVIKYALSRFSSLGGRRVHALKSRAGGAPL